MEAGQVCGVALSGVECWSPTIEPLVEHAHTVEDGARERRSDLRHLDPALDGVHRPARGFVAELRRDLAVRQPLPGQENGVAMSERRGDGLAAQPISTGSSTWHGSDHTARARRGVLLRRWRY